MTITSKSLRARIAQAEAAAGGYSPSLEITLKLPQALDLANQLDSAESEQHTELRPSALRALRREIHQDIQSRLDRLNLGLARRLVNPSPQDSVRAVIAALALVGAIRGVLDTWDQDVLVRDVEDALQGMEQLKRLAALDIPSNAEIGLPVAAMRIDALEGDLSTRTRNCLRLEDIKSVADLLLRSKTELQKIPNLGRKGIAEIEHYLAAHGLRLRADGGAR